MPSYTARMEHNKETITRLSVTQYSIFEFGKKLIRIVTALGLIIYGLYADQSMVTPMICLILGCMLIANFNLRAKVRAGKIIEQINGNFPKSKYSFFDDSFTDCGDGKPIPYSRLIKLVEDRQYMYLFISRMSAYMVDKSTVGGSTVDDLKSYLTRKTGMEWVRPVSFFNFSIRSLINRSDRYEGPRLK